MRLEVHESSLLVLHSTCVRHTVTQVINRTWVLDHTLSSHARIFSPSTIEDLHSFTYPAQRFQQLSIPPEARPCIMAHALPAFKLNNGISIPALGFGTFAKEGVPGVMHEAVVHALEVGYRHLDCAW